MAAVAPFSFGGFRSFSQGIHRFGTIGRMNLIAGPNNSGKSNVLGFLVEHYGNLVKATHGQLVPWSFTPLDRHLGTGDGSLTFGIGMDRSGPEVQAILESSDFHTRLRGHGPTLLGAVLDAFAADDGLAWFNFRASTLGAPLELVHPSDIRSALSPSDWQRLWHGLTGQNYGGIDEHWIPESLRALRPRREAPKVDLIEAVRRVGQPGVEAQGFSGVGIIDRLAQMQNPSQDKQAEKGNFAKINRFLQTVLDDSEANIEIPYQRDTILVHQKGRTLPLPSLGTGVHEVIILAAASTILQKQVVCIEEPELHLHPLLQRKLLRYLMANTDNQYFVTTHSAALLDAEEAVVYRVSHDGVASTVQPAMRSKDRHATCTDLGYRASDLLQSNCIVWVEGPTDRLYVRHWISALAPDLVEGIHFSIMFYGGRLLSHLTAGDTEVTDFISLTRLNRHTVLVADSDRASVSADINSTKKRVLDEIVQSSGLAWVTAGRTIENYLPWELLDRAIRSASPAVTSVPRYTRYQIAPKFLNSTGKTIADVDKVKIAKAAVSEPARLDVLDLRERVEEVIRYIHSSNR